MNVKILFFIFWLPFSAVAQGFSDLGSRADGSMESIGCKLVLLRDQRKSMCFIMFLLKGELNSTAFKMVLQRDQRTKTIVLYWCC